MKQISNKSIKVRPWTYQQLTNIQHALKVKTLDLAITKLISEHEQKKT